MAVKNSVYVLPRSEEALEDFQWVRREIVAGGGDASVCEARFVEGLSDDSVEALFNTARDADYEELAREARALQARASRGERSLAAGEPIEPRWFGCVSGWPRSWSWTSSARAAERRGGPVRDRIGPAAGAGRGRGGGGRA